jgi:hypothetical protein
VCDLWAAVVTLFNLLTGRVLYDQPVSRDLYFQFFIVAGGLSRKPWNDLTEKVGDDLMERELLMDLDETRRQEFLPILARCLQLSPEVLEIFENVLRKAPDERWDLDAIAASDFMNQPM